VVYGQILPAGPVTRQGRCDETTNRAPGM